MGSILVKRFQESIDVKNAIIHNEVLLDTITRLASAIVKTIHNGGKIILCGNGGSASDALHFAGEIIGRFQLERDAWPAVVLNADVATMTAIANDYGYDEVFSRQARAHIKNGDIFIGISTSGNSTNVLNAVRVAHEIGADTGALLGGDGGLIGELVNYPVIIPCNVTARVQESHITIIHCICEIVEKELGK